jgi:hypothetical protein
LSAVETVGVHSGSGVLVAVGSGYFITTSTTTGVVSLSYACSGVGLAEAGDGAAVTRNKSQRIMRGTTMPMKRSSPVSLVLRWWRGGKWMTVFGGMLSMT